jgi:hypothetical protein
MSMRATAFCSNEAVDEEEEEEEEGSRRASENKNVHAALASEAEDTIEAEAEQGGCHGTREKPPKTLQAKKNRVSHAYVN